MSGIPRAVERRGFTIFPQGRRRATGLWHSLVAPKVVLIQWLTHTWHLKILGGVGCHLLPLSVISILLQNLTSGVMMLQVLAYWKYVSVYAYVPHDSIWSITVHISAHGSIRFYCLVRSQSSSCKYNPHNWLKMRFSEHILLLGNTYVCMYAYVWIYFPLHKTTHSFWKFHNFQQTNRHSWY